MFTYSACQLKTNKQKNFFFCFKPVRHTKLKCQIHVGEKKSLGYGGRGGKVAR